MLDEEGELTIKQVTEILGRSVSATSRLLDQLVERGMVSRREDKHDRRTKRIAITEQGRMLIATLEQRRAGAQIAVMEYYSAEVQAEINRAMALLPKLVREGDAMTIQSPTPQNSEIQADIVLPFTAINLSSLPIVGGKAANLGEMIHAALPVPPGFCVTTSAYRLVAQGIRNWRNHAYLELARNWLTEIYPLRALRVSRKPISISSVKTL